jgi:hypothetical protein
VSMSTPCPLQLKGIIVGLFGVLVTGKYPEGIRDVPVGA